VLLELDVWLNHFEYHAQHPRSLPPGVADLLRADERRLIASSIATFQLGEQSQGTTLLHAARRFAVRHASPSLVRIMELFIREEQHHAALLRGFMQDHGIALKTRDWTDRVFRRVRRLAGFELHLHVLTTAELIGNVYYRALEAATDCQRLKLLCRNLVCDELAHVGFESQLLLALRARRAATVRAALRSAHRAFLAAAAVVVWITHRRVLQRAGYRLASFMRACLAQHDFYLDPLAAALPSASLP